MRAKTTLVLTILGCALLVVSPTVANGQPGGGGFGGRGKGGSGAMGGGGMDGNVIFDMMAKGRPYFLITDSRQSRESLTQFALEKGITNGQITRPQYLEYFEQRKAKFSAGAGAGKSPFSFQTPAGAFGQKNPDGSPAPMSSSLAPGAGYNPDVINQLADGSFKRNDVNGDGKLNEEEMPPPLRSNLANWDKSGDKLINLNEYRDYFATRLGGGENRPPAASIATIIIEEEELDKKPVVFRAGGKMPAGLPGWFKELDTLPEGADGQVALYEWRKGGKDLDEFKAWDLNDDGFITPDEALRYVATLKKSNPNASLTSGSTPFGGSGERPSFGSRTGNGERPAFGGFRGKKGERP